MAKGKLQKSSESELAAQVRTAIGIGPNEEVEVQTPQFTRPTNELGPTQAPTGKAGFDALRSMSEQELLRMGMRRWGRPYKSNTSIEKDETGPMLWLFPGEWYDAIPQGYPIVRGVSDCEHHVSR